LARNAAYPVSRPSITSSPPTSSIHAPRVCRDIPETASPPSTPKTFWTPWQAKRAPTTTRMRVYAISSYRPSQRCMFLASGCPILSQRASGAPQRFAQPEERGADAGLHRAQGLAETLGDLGLREALVVGQLQGPALIGGEPGQDLAHGQHLLRPRHRGGGG